jgi:anti-sigma factor RsiW
MKSEFELKLQAHLDGELGAGEARALEARLATDPAAQSLLGELRMTRAAVRGNEIEHPVPATREFYWSGIERRIEAWERANPPASPFGLGWLFRYWPQLSGAAVAALLLLLALAQFSGGHRGGWVDIDNPLAETGTFCFRSESDRMTLIWVYDRTPDPDESEEVVN